jgi:D-3-phosphoglycerate dehydrogenase
MKIAVLHDESAYAASEFEHLTARLSDHKLVTWRPAAPPPANDFQILLGAGEIDRKLLETQPQLELVQTTSAGYKGVDVEAASSLGIWVSFAPSGETGNASSVAEWAVLLLLASSRDLSLALESERDRDVKLERPAQALLGKDVCIVGFGGVGRELVKRLRPFGVHFTIVDDHPERAPNDADAYAAGDLKVAMTGADYVVLCIPATPANENLIDASALASMKQGAIFVNVARGTLVDEPALTAALESGRIRAREWPHPRRRRRCTAQRAAVDPRSARGRTARLRHAAHGGRNRRIDRRHRAIRRHGHRRVCERLALELTA